MLSVCLALHCFALMWSNAFRVCWFYLALRSRSLCARSRPAWCFWCRNLRCLWSSSAVCPGVRSHRRSCRCTTPLQAIARENVSEGEGHNAFIVSKPKPGFAERFRSTGLFFLIPCNSNLTRPSFLDHPVEVTINLSGTASPVTEQQQRDGASARLYAAAAFSELNFHSVLFVQDHNYTKCYSVGFYVLKYRDICSD